MRTVLQIISFAGLACTLLPSLFVFTGDLSFGMHTRIMAVGMLLWFASAPFWIKERQL